MGAVVFVGPGTLTPALSRRERGRGWGVGQPVEIPDRQRRDGGPERVVRGEGSVVAVPVLPRRRDKIGEAVEKLPRREIDDAVLSGAGGLALAAGADPLGALVSRE